MSSQFKFPSIEMKVHSLFSLFFRADCSNADKPGAIPQHNGLTPFGKVSEKEAEWTLTKSLNDMSDQPNSLLVAIRVKRIVLPFLMLPINQNS